MPMDDNDSHYQGLSEDNSKITSIVHPHWLPKFDFDSTHTRFDSLVENEVAISSREDNIWNSASNIVFSSSATESCSIPGRFDVWAEATSLESIELLLKSVGQEEMLPAESIIEEPGTCDELGTLAKQMELNSRQGGHRNDQDSNKEVQLVQPSDSRVLLSQCSGSTDIKSECVSLTKVEHTEFGCSVVNLERTSLVLSEWNSHFEGTFDDSNQPKSGTNLNESLNSSMDGHLVLQRQRTSDFSSQFVVKDAELTDVQHSSKNKPLENACTEAENVEGAEEENPQRNSSSVDNLSVRREHADMHSSIGEFSTSVVSNEEPTQNFEDLSSVPGKEEFSLPSNVNNQDILPVAEYWQNSEGSKLPESLEIKHSTDKYDKSPRGSVGDLRADKQAFESTDAEVHGVDVDCERWKHSPSPTSYRESSNELDESYPKRHIEVVQGTSATTSECKVPGVVPELRSLITEDKFNFVNNLPILVDEQNELDNLVTEDQVNYVDNLPILAHASQYAQSVAKDAIENRKETNGATESLEVTVMSSAPPGTVMLMEATCSGKFNAPNQDTVNEKQDSGFEVSNSVIMYNDAAMISSFSLDEGVKKKVGVEHNLESQKPSSIGPETSVGCIDSNIASQQISRYSSSLSASHDTADEIVKPNEEVNLHSEESLPDKEDTGTDFKSETEPPSEIENDTGTVSLAERITCRTVSTEELFKDASSLRMIETYDGDAVDEGAAVHTKEILGSSKKIDLDCAPCGSKVGEAEVAMTVAVAEHEGSKTESSSQAKLLEVPGGGNLGEPDKHNHGTCSVYRSSKLSELDGSKEEGHIDSVAGHVSDNTCKAAEIPLKPKIDIAGDGSREEMSFSFAVPPVVGMRDGESGIDLQPFCSIKACKMPMGKKQYGSTPSGSQKDNRDAKEVSQVTIVVTEGETASAGPKSTTDRKTRRRSTKSTNNKAKKGNNVVQPDGNRSCALVSHSGPDRILQFDVGSTESSGRNIAPSHISTPNLPDLNNSVSNSALFHRPFSDLQQVQLRAQIFVYGSLIQGVAPDEACMVSAFGTSDGGRDVWEPKWRACVEKFHREPSSNCSTPVQSRSGSKAQNKSSKQQCIPQSKAVPPLATLLGTKVTLCTPVKPMIPLSSPLWNLSAPSRGASQAVPPIHSCQTPPTRIFDGQTTSWLSPAPVPGPWVSSSWTSALNFSDALSSLPSTETVKLTPLSCSFLPVSTSVKLASDTPISHFRLSNNLGLGSSMEMSTSSCAHNSAASKSRKRKKSKTTEESHQNSLSTTFTRSVPYPVTSHQSNEGPAGVFLGLRSSLATTTPLIESQFFTSVAATTSPVVVVDTIQKGEIHMENSVAHKCGLRPVEEAKLAGKEAVAYAADVVSRCQSIWSVLEEQQHSRLDPDTEAQLSSSAAALAAAVSVAKAAAAAAKLASSAALHFHQLAVEALTLNGGSAQDGVSTVSDATNNLNVEPPSSIFSDGIGNHTLNPIMNAAGKAAWTKVDTSLAAFEHAENLDAIVKAAGLAAEAVSQAGRVVAIGKPLPLSALIEAGFENYWRGDAQFKKSNADKSDKRDTMNSKEMCRKPEGPSDLERCTMIEGSSLSNDIARVVEKNIRLGEEDFSAAHMFSDNGNRDTNDSPVPENIEASSVASDCAVGVNVPVQNAYGIPLKGGSITENCAVEVFKHSGSFKGAWYSAKVLSLNDDKALVCYTDLQLDKESDPLREWVPLEGEKKEVPIMRVAHPMSRVHLEGTRKRCRAALTEYHWSVGDRVDAWIGDCWREGDITDQNKNDPTKFTIHFPGDGETSIVKAWHLRPTLTWKNGEWIELLSSRRNASSQGDTPNEKRLRWGSHIELKGKGEIPKDKNNSESLKVEYPRVLPLSSTEKLCNIGSSRDENEAYPPRMMRSGLQKEGSKFFGVPRPGKKKKYMDVSKHYVSEGSTKDDVPTDSSKLSKFLKPQVTGLRGFKNGSAVDSKDKQVVEYKLKAPKTGKLPGLSSRTLPQKEISTPALSGPRETISRRHAVKDPTSNDGKSFSCTNLIRSGPVSNHEAGFNVPVPTQTHPSDRNKKVARNINSERRMKGKLGVAGARMKKSVAEDKLIPDSTGTRRSNRTIQPTSRLLEGLQSSLKIPSASHNTSHRVQTKGPSRDFPDRFK